DCVHSSIAHKTNLYHNRFCAICQTVAQGRTCSTSLRDKKEMKGGLMWYSRVARPNRMKEAEPFMKKGTQDRRGKHLLMDIL
ncbi:MAG: hypothetical protein PUE14_05130, partial [Clostridia bacterium]|nr:hypothetical protein [Clostridia bacterium]